ncbi:uncharacterized protein OCT59_004073 [Rhizophagus irregularis]|uniref:uncharacterized protein n=1 Tax=Rhizophagus irregularis TaxID=588596 RepID=UPI003319FEFC|nr:hypothetical protein OCT59_004073 [Rhizophagus irregularis]
MSKTKDKCKNCADFDAKLEFIIFIIFILFFISALLLKVSETMTPGEPGGPSPPVTLGGIIRTNSSGLSLKISIFLILIARRTRYSTSQDIEGNSNKKHVRESDDDQVEILEISDTNNTNEDFCSTLKNDKKRVKIGNTSICKKVTKPDKESLLAISKIGDPIIDSLFYSLGKLKKTGVKSVAMNLVNNSIRFITLD